jgi:hypothetical protein
MTPKVVELAVTLEKDLADFYQELGRIEHLKPYADIFSFMVDHSASHANQIEQAARALSWRALDTEPITALHARLKSSLREEIQSEGDHSAVLAKLARTEEIIGQMYRTIAGHYRKRAESCTAVADTFEQLAREEFDHRDYILEQSL